jgi:hypothetical protein
MLAFEVGTNLPVQRVCKSLAPERNFDEPIQRTEAIQPPLAIDLYGVRPTERRNWNKVRKHRRGKLGQKKRSF